MVGALFQDIPLKLYKWCQHHIHQFVGHANLMEKISDDYDVIVKYRYDVVPINNVDLEPLIKDCYENGTVFGFNVQKPPLPTRIERIKKPNCPLDKSVKNNLHYVKGFPWLADHVIIYPRHLFKSERVYRLIENYEMRPVEWGWYQLLIEQNNHKQPISFKGGFGYRF